MSYPEGNPSIVFVGDLTFDAVTDLTHLDLGRVDEAIYERCIINHHIGGTALNPAIAAKQVGFSKVALISRIGVDAKTGVPDPAGRVMENTLRKHGIEPFLFKDTDAPTGKTIIVYFAGDQRILVADRGANTGFKESDIDEKMKKLLTESDIVFISGYWLLEQGQAQAVKRLTEAAAALNCVVVLDVVPHRIFDVLQHDQFVNLTSSVHVVVAETNTLRQLFPRLSHLAVLRSPMSSIDEELSYCRQVIDITRDYYRAAILCPSNLRLVVSLPGKDLFIRETGWEAVSGSDRVGYIDKQVVTVLREYHQHFA